MNRFHRFSGMICILLSMGVSLQTFGQTKPPQTPAGQKQVVKLNPVKPDSLDPKQKALRNYSNAQLSKKPAPEKKITDPNELRALELFKAGGEKCKAGDYEGGITEYTKSLGIFKNGNTYIRRGFAYLMLGNYQSALRDATDGLALLPNYPDGNFVRGIARYEMGDIQGAEDDLKVCIMRDRSNPLARNYMAAIKFKKLDYKGAVDQYTAVINLDPKYPEAYSNRGMMRHYLRDFKGAIQDYDEAIKQNPESPSAYNNRGAAKLILKQLQPALEDFNKAVSLDPRYANAFDNRARVKHEMGDQAGACSDWQSAYTLGLTAAKDLIIKYCK